MTYLGKEFSSSDREIDRVKTGHIFWGALFFYIFMLITGFLSDAMFPAFVVKNGSIIFHGSFSIGLTLMNLSLLFLAIIMLIALVSVSQGHEGSLTKKLLWRRLFVGSILILLFAGTFFGSIYVLSKKIVVSEEKILYYSLIERKEVQWSEVKRMDGNFVPGSRLGLRGRGNYAWVDFTTINGETIHLPLRFMTGISQLEKIIMQNLNWRRIR